MKYVYLSWRNARPLIQEGDVLLFRGHGFFSFFIKKLTQSNYSHAALASWHNGNGILELLEFHLHSGGVARNLENVVKKYPKIIDVYRPTPTKIDTIYQPLEHKIVDRKIVYNGKAVTNTMRKLTALPYSVVKIGLCARGLAFGFRFFTNIDKITDDTLKPSLTHVCSSSVAYAMNDNGYDLVKNKSDLRTTPADLSKSPLLHYLFTLK